MSFLCCAFGWIMLSYACICVEYSLFNIFIINVILYVILILLTSCLSLWCDAECIDSQIFFYLFFRQYVTKKMHQRINPLLIRSLFFCVQHIHRVIIERILSWNICFLWLSKNSSIVTKILFVLGFMNTLYTYYEQHKRFTAQKCASKRINFFFINFF